MTIIWCMVPEIWSMTDIIFCQFGSFLPFYPRNNPKNQNLNKWKKHLEISSFYTCVSQNSSWDVEHDRQNFCHIGPFFALLSPWQPKKSKLWKNEKTTWRYYHFTHVYYKWKSYDVWFLRYGACDGQNFLSFWTICCLFTHPPTLPP